MLIAALLFACSSDQTNISDDGTPEPVVDGPTRPIVEPVDSAPLNDTGPDTETTDDTSPWKLTGETGEPPIDTGLHILEGRAFRFSPNALTVTLAGAIGLNLYETAFLVEVLAVDQAAGTIDLRAASYDPATGVQAVCTPSIDVVADFSGDPVAEFGPIDGDFGLWGKPTPIELATGQLLFDPAYENISSANLDALWDIDQFVDFYYGSGYAPSFCSTLAAYYGGGCTTCPTSGSTTCISASTTGAVARWESTLVVAEITDTDIAGNPACN